MINITRGMILLATHLLVFCCTNLHALQGGFAGDGESSDVVPQVDFPVKRMVPLDSAAGLIGLIDSMVDGRVQFDGVVRLEGSFRGVSHIFPKSTPRWISERHGHFVLGCVEEGGATTAIYYAKSFDSPWRLLSRHRGEVSGVWINDTGEVSVCIGGSVETRRLDGGLTRRDLLPFVVSRVIVVGNGGQVLFIEQANGRSCVWNYESGRFRKLTELDGFVSSVGILRNSVLVVACWSSGRSKLLYIKDGVQKTLIEKVGYINPMIDIRGGGIALCAAEYVVGKPMPKKVWIYNIDADYSLEMVRSFEFDGATDIYLDESGRAWVIDSLQRVVRESIRSQAKDVRS